MRLRRIFSKKPELVFSCAIAGIADLYPICKASEVPKKWLGESKSAKKCPSISRLVRIGWVQVAWQDIHIKTGENDFSWVTPINQHDLSTHISVSDYVSWHKDEYHELVPDDEVIDQVIKIQAPWMARIPKGFSLLSTDWRFGDAKPYTTVTGLVRGDTEVTQLSVHLKAKKNTEFVIKAGQPLQQYFLIPDKQPDFVVRTATQDDMDNYQKLYIRNRNTLKEE